MMPNDKLLLRSGFPPLVLAMLLHAGCSGSPQGRIVAVPATEITAGATGEIEHTYATYGQVEGGLAVVIWSDLAAIRSSSGASADKAEFIAYHGDASGREIRWQSRVTRDRLGRVNINGNEFELAQGRLFLASVVSGKPMIEQLNYDIGQFEDHDLPDSLRGWLTTEPEIQAFFQQAAASAHRQRR